MPGLESKGLGGITNVKIGHSVRDVVPGSGTQAITGMGFKPKIVIILARSVAGKYQIWSTGFDDATDHYCQFMAGNSVDVDNITEQSICIIIDGSNYAIGRISSMDADGFSITWSFTGVLTVDFIYLAMK